MADEPISALTLIAAPTGTPPYPTAFTNPSTGAMLEILDTTNTTMASTGTNSRIPPGHLLMGFLNPGSNVTLSETSGIVTIAASGGGGMSVGSAVSGGSNHATLVEDGSGNLAALAIGTTGQVLTVASGAPAWAAPLTSNYASARLTGNFTCSSGAFTDTGLSITLPKAGVYLITGCVNGGVSGQATVAGQGTEFYVQTQLWDVSTTAYVSNSISMIVLFFPQVANLLSGVQGTGAVGPFLYTAASDGIVIKLYGGVFNYVVSGSSSNMGGSIQSGTSGETVLTALRIA